MTRFSGVMAVSLAMLCAEAHAACGPVRTSSEKLASFMERPADLLDQFPAGSNLMSYEVTELAMASATTLMPMRSIFRNTNASQRESIGDGLARAYRTCRGQSSEQARAIRELGLNGGNADIARSFTLHSNDSDDDIAQPKPQTSDSGLFRGPATDDGARRSSSYLSGTSVFSNEPNSKRSPIADPFAPVEIIRR